MPVIGITGGIGTGKTAFTQIIQRALRAEAFDADACARDLVSSDPHVRQEIRQQFGSEVFAAGGEIDRARLREIVFADDTKRRALEMILHPVIRERWIRLAEGAKASKQLLLVDIPLLFETAAERFFDAVVVIACSAATQRRRLMELRNLPSSIAEKIIAAQLPLAEKIERADHVIWNDGDLAALEQQTTLLSTYVKLRYG